MPLSFAYTASAVEICARLLFLAISLALDCAPENLGTSAATKIPIITITISISTSVNHFHAFILCFKVIRYTTIQIKVLPSYNTNPSDNKGQYHPNMSVKIDFWGVVKKICLQSA